jgi:hypothetical protein
MQRYLFSAVFLLVILAGGCSSLVNLVTPITTETMGPTVTIGWRGEVYSQNATPVPPTYQESSSAPFYFNVSASDPGGVKSLYLNFSSNSAQCYFSNSGTYSGAFVAAIPSGAATSSPNSQGQVPTNLATASSFQGPFSCTEQGVPGTGVVVGPIYVTATATNYSGRTSTQNVVLTLQP